LQQPVHLQSPTRTRKCDNQSTVTCMMCIFLYIKCITGMMFIMTFWKSLSIIKMDWIKYYWFLHETIKLMKDMRSS
jgi:hypothetical protein